MDDQEIHDTFWGHVNDLKHTLVSIAAIIITACCLTLYFSQAILNFLVFPLEELSPFSRSEVKTERIVNTTSYTQIYELAANETLIAHSQAQPLSSHAYSLPPHAEIIVERNLAPHKLALLSPLEGMIATFTLSFWTGLVCSAPLWLFFLLKFITPALHAHEKALLVPFLLLAFLFLAAGIAFAYAITIPLANAYLLTFNTSLGINLWSLSSYLDYTFILLLSTGLAFEIGLALLYLIHLDVFSAAQLISKRRHAIVTAFILGAVFTPPDVLTQFMLAIPLIALYELAILYAKIKARKRKKFAAISP